MPLEARHLKSQTEICQRKIKFNMAMKKINIAAKS